MIHEDKSLTILFIYDNMRILRKSAPNYEQLMVREFGNLEKRIENVHGEGTEIILLPSFLTREKLEITYNDISRYLDKTKCRHFGLEVADVSHNSFPYFDESFLLIPASVDPVVRSKSQNCLMKIARKFVTLFKERGLEVYLNVQATGDKYIQVTEHLSTPSFKPSKDERKELIKEFSKFLRKLENDIDVSVMLENQNSVCATFYHPNKPVYNTVIGARLDDYEALGISGVDDVAHHAANVYTLGEGVLYPYGVPTKTRGRFLVELSEDEREFGRVLAPLINSLPDSKKEIQRIVTDEVIKQIKRCGESIECVHFNNIHFVGVEVEMEEGLPDLSEEMIDLPKVFDYGIRKINPQFIVPEVTEDQGSGGYSNPGNQRKMAKWIFEKSC
jgi:hypothetical protein